MLRLFRVRAWCLATALALAASTMGVSLEILLHADPAHADACAPPAAAAHDASAHRVGSPDESSHGGPTHCVACHWARSLKPGVHSTMLSARPARTRPLPAAPDAGPAIAPALAHLHPRSPPRFA